MSLLMTQSYSLVPDVAAIRADLEATRVAYEQLLGSLSQAELERPLIISKWTVKEVMCHLVLALEQANPMMVAKARKNQPMPKFLDTRLGHWLNYQMAVWQARKATIQSLAQRYEAAHQNFLNLLAGVKVNEWQQVTALPDGTPLMMDAIFAVPGQHFALHAGWVKQVIKS